MSQVSKHSLRPDVERRINIIFTTILSDIHGKEEVSNFLEDFLSPTEKIVLVKRLAIAVLLAKGNDYMSIRQTLRVTPGTISKMSLKIGYGNGAIKKIANYIANSDYGKAILDEMLSIFEYEKPSLTGEFYNKNRFERDQDLKRLKRGI